MRKTWKEFGLGLLNLIAVCAIIAFVMVTLKRHLPSAVPIVLGVLILPAYWLGVTWIERRDPQELAPSRALPEVFKGIIIGAALFSGVVLILWALGSYRLQGWGNNPQLAWGFMFAVFAGVLEEVLFRGFLLRLFTKILGTWGALLFTAALFGAAHAGNHSATLGSSVAIAIEAGILLGAAYALTNRLWLPIGLHIGWNFCEGSIFGLTLSGNAMEPGTIRGTLQGPAILTGGAFGLEASLVAVLMCLSVAVLWLWRAASLRLIEVPAWARRGPTRAVTQDDA